MTFDGHDSCVGPENPESFIESLGGPWQMDLHSPACGIVGIYAPEVCRYWGRCASAEDHIENQFFV